MQTKDNFNYTSSMEKMKVIAIRCSCTTQEHLLTVTFSKEPDGFMGEGGPELFVSTQLYPGTFWQKMKLAIKFLLGKAEPYGHWDTTMVAKPEAEQLKGILEEFLASIHEHETKLEDGNKSEAGE